MAAPADEPGLPRRTIVLIVTIGGGVLALSLLLAAAMPAGGPFMALVAFAFFGAVALFVGSFLGALSSRFSQPHRVGFGAGAVLAFLLVLILVFVGPAVATESAPVCGLVAAGPGLLALRSFTLLRDAGL